ERPVARAPRQNAACRRRDALRGGGGAARSHVNCGGDGKEAEDRRRGRRKHRYSRVLRGTAFGSREYLSLAKRPRRGSAGIFLGRPLRLPTAGIFLFAAQEALS